MLFLSVLGLVTFAIEDAIDLKIKTPFTIVLSYLLMQMVIASLIPTSNSTPLISDYVLASLFVSVGSALAAAAVFYLAQLDGEPPTNVHRVIVHWLAFPLYPSRWKALLSRVCCRRGALPPLLAGSLVGPMAGGSSTPFPESPHSRHYHHRRDAEGGAWAEIASTFNRLFAVAYVIVSLLLFCLYLLPIFLAY